MCNLAVEPDLPRTHFKKEYDCKCFVCGEQFTIVPSLMMIEFGMNIGSCTCYKCKTLLRLKIYPDLAGEIIVSEENHF